MCLLTYFPEDVQPNVDALTRGAINNPDGNGYAMIVNNRIIVRKSMEADRLIEEFEHLRKKHPEGPAMFHSRIGTGGTVTEKNCHPFNVGGDPRTVVGHNGILPATMQPAKGDRRCDTRIFATTHLPYRNLNSAKSRRRLGKWLAGDKLVILTVNPAHKQRAYLINEYLGEWDDESGIWYSNASHEEWYGKYTVVRYGGVGLRDSGSRYTNWWDDAEDPYGYGDRPYYYAKCHSERLGDHCHLDPEGPHACEGCGVVWEYSSGRESVNLGEDSGTEGLSTLAQQWAAERATDHLHDAASLATRLGDECVACGTIGYVSSVTLTCSMCYTCQECRGMSDPGLMTAQDVPCLCYTPDSVTAAALLDDTAGRLDDATAGSVMDLFGDEL